MLSYGVVTFAVLRPSTYSPRINEHRLLSFSATAALRVVRNPFAQLRITRLVRSWTSDLPGAHMHGLCLSFSHSDALFASLLSVQIEGSGCQVRRRCLALGIEQDAGAIGAHRRYDMPEVSQRSCTPESFSNQAFSSVI